MITDLPFRNVFSLFILISILTNLILGGLVLADSPRRKINRLFALLSAALSAWGMSFIGFNLSNNAFSSLAWSRLYALSSLFIPPIFFDLVIGSIGNSLKIQRFDISLTLERIKRLAYVFSGGWFLLTISGVFPHATNKAGFLSLPVVGQQYWIGAVIYLVLTALSVYLLFYQARNAVDVTQKNRLEYLFMGASVVLIGGMLNFLFFQVDYVNAGWIVSLGHMSISLSLVMIAYALTASQLYHFSELLRKSIAFFSMTFILLVVFGGTHLIANKILVPYIPRSDIFALATSSIIMALVFHPLRFRVQNLVDRVFFKRRFDQMQHLRELSRKVLSSTDREELLKELFKQLNNIGFGSLTLLLKDPQKPIFHIRKSYGLKKNADGFFLRSDSLLVQYIREEKEALINDEVTRRILTDWERQALNDEMGVLQAEICFPLFSTRRRALFGVFTLGNSDLGYSSYKGRNIFWLKSLIDNVGIMLDNFFHQEFANALVPYVGRSWADEMRRNKEGFRERLSGHRTWVSIVMVDIRHFTNLSASMDPQDVVSLLKDFRSRVAPIVYRHQGTIDKFIGDAIMIVFGLPILPHIPNPDKNAVECAMAISKEIEEMNTKRFAEGRKERISIGIGVSSGEVIAGNVDSGDRVEYTVIGDAANMVARLEDLAGDNQILLSPATQTKVKDYFNLNPWPARHITGFNEPIQVFELLGFSNNQHELRIINPVEKRQIAANQ